MKYFGMTIMSAGLALTAAYYFGVQSMSFAEAGSSACHYDVQTVTGGVTMHGDLTVALDTTSPSGESTPDVHSYLRINVTAGDAGCDAITVKRMLVDMEATDLASTNWVRRASRSGITLEDVDTGDVLATGVPTRIRANEVRFALSSFVLTAGETRTLDVYADANGASDDMDDMLKLSIPANGITWSDEHRTVREMRDVLEGNSIVF